MFTDVIKGIYFIQQSNQEGFMAFFPTSVMLLCLGTLSLASKFPCEFISNEWKSGQSFNLSERELIVPTKYGYHMIVDAMDNTVSRAIKEQGTWQPDNMHVIAYFLKPGDKVLNLGAQTGLEAILMGRIIGSKGQMHIFEPYSVSYAILKKNIYLNDLENITTLYQVGAGDIQTKADILVLYENTGGAEIYMSNFPANLEGRRYSQERVCVDLVDNVLPSDIKLDFILMDVEKMEVEALLGIRSVLNRSPKVVVMFEWQYSANSKRSQAKAMRLLHLLSSTRLKLYQYEANKQDRCKIGKFTRIEDFFTLLNMPVSDLFLVPMDMDPNAL